MDDVAVQIVTKLIKLRMKSNEEVETHPPLAKPITEVTPLPMTAAEVDCEFTNTSDLKETISDLVKAVEEISNGARRIKKMRVKKLKMPKKRPKHPKRHGDPFSKKISADSEAPGKLVPENGQPRICETDASIFSKTG